MSLSAQVLARSFESAIDEAMERLLKAPLAASPIVNLSRSIDVGEFWSNGFRIRLCSLTTTRIFGSLHLPVSIGDQVIGENG
jgi:hypothetical protein